MKFSDFARILVASFRKPVGRVAFARSAVFDALRIDAGKRRSFNTLCGLDTEFIWAFLYTECQKTHVSMMLEKDFPCPLTGLVHVSNQIETRQDFEADQFFTLKTTVEIPASERSLVLHFSTQLVQHQKLVAEFRSVYLFRRKSKTTGEKKAETVEMDDFLEVFQESLDFDINLSRAYARVSGDWNPIHVSTFAARVFGFQHPIAHGWFAASRCLASLMIGHRGRLKSFSVDFERPLPLPSKTVFQSGVNGFFQLRSESGERVLRGRLM